MRFSIHTLIQLDRRFVPLEQVARSPADTRYLNGAIVWKIGAATILSEQHWDLVDQLWVSLINGLPLFHEQGRFAILFPDQPLQLSCRQLDGGKVEVIVGDDRHVVDRRDFLDSLTFGAEAFFTWALRVLRGGTTFQRELQLVTRCKADLAGSR